MTLVLSCDPGLAHGGFALLDMSARKPRVVKTETVNTSSGGSFRDRAKKHLGTLVWAVTYWDVTLFAVEDQSRTQIAMQQIRKSSASAAYARDVQRLLEGAALARDLGLASIAPQTWRARLGLTRATDAQIKRFVRATCDGLPKVLSIHATEAICIGIVGWRQWAVDSRRRK